MRHLAREKHLSPDQFSESLLGQSESLLQSESPLQKDAWAAEHLRSCPGCRAGVANFREALGEFRGAVRGWSEHQAAVAMQPRETEARAWAASHQLAFAILLATVCILASFVLPRHPRENAAGSDAVLLNRDAVLLNQVDGQVSRTVPRSMEPLMKLVVQE